MNYASRAIPLPAQTAVGHPQQAWLTPLISALDQQREILARIDELGRRVGGLVDGEDPTELLLVLTARERVIGELQESSKTHAPLVSQWNQWRGTLSEADRRLVQHRLDDITWLQKRVSERDDTDRRRLETRRDAIAAELGRMNNAGKANAAYGRSPGASNETPRFQDREC